MTESEVVNELTCLCKEFGKDDSLNAWVFSP
jgi:hypothetical protein